MSYRLTKIYTRSGDDGQTNLGSADRLAKNQPRIEVLGTLDELNCVIGLVLSAPTLPPDVHACLSQLQHQLFDVGGELCPPYHIVMTDNNIAWLEQTIDRWNETLSPLTEFVLPKGSFAVASCHLARAVCRRAERCLVGLMQQEKINPDLLRYMNRLSDLLFVASRILAKSDPLAEEVWKHERNKA